MSTKEKAVELISKFKPFANYKEDDCFNQIEKMLINAKQCALIAVDEIIKDRERLKDALFYNSEYWEKVKIEIQKL